MSIVKMTKGRIKTVTEVRRIGGLIEDFVRKECEDEKELDWINESVAIILANIVTNPDIDEETLNYFLWFIGKLERMIQKK